MTTYILKTKDDFEDLIENLAHVEGVGVLRSLLKKNSLVDEDRNHIIRIKFNSDTMKSQGALIYRNKMYLGSFNWSGAFETTDGYKFKHHKFYKPRNPNSEELKNFKKEYLAICKKYNAAIYIEGGCDITIIQCPEDLGEQLENACVIDFEEHL